MKSRSLFTALALLLLLTVAAMPKATNAKAATTVNHELRTELVTLVNETTNLSTPIASITDEDYHPHSRKWGGVCSVITAGQNVYVAWMTGGLREPDPNKLNYIAVAASPDGGQTWIDPFMIIDPVVENQAAYVPMFYYNSSGQMFLTFLWSGGPGGFWSIPINNPDGPLPEVTYGEPFPCGPSYASYTKPTHLSDGSIMWASGKSTTIIYRSLNDGLTYSMYSEITDSPAPSSARIYAESSIVEKNDGTLWHLRRLEGGARGGIEQSFSIDGGLTWSTPQGNLPHPLRSPGSRFTMQRLKSGALLFVTNAGGSGATDRVKMTAYLSYDDGDTWPYSLLLDKTMSSYPDFHQAEDGTIYIAFDKDRYGEGSIRLCILTEEDIRAGAFVSEKAKQLITVYKRDTSYADIKEVEGFPKIARYKVGTVLSEIQADLPKTITVTDEYGNKHQITGRYSTFDFKADKAGTYTFTFVLETDNSKLKDSFNLFTFKVVLYEDTGCSCGGATVGEALPIIAAASCICFLRLRKRSKGK